MKYETEMAWFDENEAFLEEQHAGQWVAVKGRKLVAVGDSVEAVTRHALERGARDPLIAVVKLREFQGQILVR